MGLIAVYNQCVTFGFNLINSPSHLVVNLSKYRFHVILKNLTSQLTCNLSLKGLSGLKPRSFLFLAEGTSATFAELTLRYRQHTPWCKSQHCLVRQEVC